ncbi:hypothetical protein [Bradyrhizobium sp. 44]|uniref:hypothetical protein n=1 Tax=Bradyrhizobium sp. 44 TaxID=2782675 RepID=UPI001FFBC161|nr:hypothetical protein [Bradyrhizobium sp. 44]
MLQLLHAVCRMEIQPRRAGELPIQADRAAQATVLIVDDDPDVRAFLIDSHAASLLLYLKQH